MGDDGTKKLEPLTPLEEAGVAYIMEIGPGLVKTQPVIDAIAEAVVARLRGAAPLLSEPQPVLLGKREAARLLGCSVAALNHRIERHQLPTNCVVRLGKSFKFHRERLLAGIERKVVRQ